MKAVMLAAGVGSRLAPDETEPSPKVLLRFGGKSLLEHHLEIFQQHGIDELVIGVGYRNQEIEQEILDLGAGDFVRTILNKDYLDGSIVTLWTCGTNCVAKHKSSCWMLIFFMITEF